MCRAGWYVPATIIPIASAHYAGTYGTVGLAYQVSRGLRVPSPSDLDFPASCSPWCWGFIRSSVVITAPTGCPSRWVDLFKVSLHSVPASGVSPDVHAGSGVLPMLAPQRIQAVTDLIKIPTPRAPGAQCVCLSQAP